MDEQRLIDANSLLQKIGNYDLRVVVRKNDGRLEIMTKVVQAVQDHAAKCVLDAPTINPEDLPVVQQLREEIDKLSHSVENLSQNLETAYRQRDIYKSCFERITAHGDCNNCADIKVCEFAPDCGEDTRFNCPLWRGKKEG